MTVRELIDLLREYDQNLEVLIDQGDDPDRHQYGRLTYPELNLETAKIHSDRISYTLSDYESDKSNRTVTILHIS